ncbi:MAG TPA: hypothetical protein EYQ85_01950 [Candidatus Poseidoniales archaeon]|jgi:hypothetical protein|nr:MAG: hypothetical protein CXT68_05875 [Euryarchaeota archaeon]HIF16000.1 hypothetical protein [Candidatus Poseidoniales archaeon]
MVGVELLESIAQIFCGLSLFGFMFIATASRSEKLESFVQWMVVACSLFAAIMLFWLWGAGGTIWGSEGMIRPLAVLCILIALAARLNLKGKQLSQGMNPHQIMKENRQEEE